MPGGTQIWRGFGCDGCHTSLKTPTNLKGHFGRKKVLIFRDFSRNIGNFSQLWKFGENGPMLMAIFVENRTNV